MAKNKVAYIEKQTDPKVQPNFYIINDFKKPSSKKLIDSGIDSYTTTDDYVLYLKSGNLYIITDFETHRKILISANVRDYSSRKGMLFYTVVNSDTNTLYVITDFKALVKSEVVSNFSSYHVDEP